MTKVKICGITKLEDAKLVLDRGADELGFNFYRESKRYISPGNARDIIDRLPSTSRSIGVFVNEDVEELISIAALLGLDGIQLHGDEDMAYVSRLQSHTERFIIKSFRVTQDFLVSDVLGWPSDFALFDTHSTDQYGGTGATFNWNRFGSEIHLSFPRTAYLAGGLNPENVAEAIRIVRPYAVDVASGVESSPGEKDPKKVEAFIRNAKNA